MHVFQKSLAQKKTLTFFFSFLFCFLKIYFFIIIYLLERRIYREERQRGRSSVRCITPQVSATADAMPIRSQEPLPGLPHGCRVPKLWAVLDCFPGPQAGSWKGSGAAGIEPAPIWDPGRARRGPLTTCATAPGPIHSCFIRQNLRSKFFCQIHIES